VGELIHIGRLDISRRPISGMLMYPDQIITGVAEKRFTSSNVMRVKITEQEMEALLPIERDGGI
tara:strand:- start:790 stop:981 length:192 start_codon:yes stop_codon:yes gene_type:complete